MLNPHQAFTLFLYIQFIICHVKNMYSYQMNMAIVYDKQEMQ